MDLYGCKNKIFVRDRVSMKIFVYLFPINMKIQIQSSKQSFV